MNVNVESLTIQKEAELIHLHPLLLDCYLELRQVKLGEAVSCHLKWIFEARQCSCQQLPFPLHCCCWQSQAELHAELHGLQAWCQP